MLPREVLASYVHLPVLVTGARGFLGRYLCRALVNAGAEVHALHRTQPELGSSLPGTISHYADVTRPDELKEAIGNLRPRIVYHLAASVNRDISRQAVHQSFAVNAVGTHNLLQVLAPNPPDLMLMASTAEVYGQEFPPFREDRKGRPESAYASSKATAWNWARSSATPCIEARLFQVYGPRQGYRSFLSELFDAIAQGKKMALTPGEQTRDFTWVEDVVEAFLFLGQRADLQGQAFNVCTGRETSLRQVIGLLGNIVGNPLPVDIGALPYSTREVFRVVGDPLKLAQAGFRCETALEAGLARCYKALQESRT